MPFKNPRYNKLHGDFPLNHKMSHRLTQYDGRFSNEEDLLDRAFNAMLALTLLWLPQLVESAEKDSVKSYFRKI